LNGYEYPGSTGLEKEFFTYRSGQYVQQEITFFHLQNLKQARITSLTLHNIYIRYVRMNISMNKRYMLIVVVCVLVLAVLYYVLYTVHDEKEYPVYDGEEILEDSYPYTFVFFGDNRPASGKNQPEVFKTMIQKINHENPLFVIGGGDFVVEGTPENFEEFEKVSSALNPPLFYVCGNHDDSVYYEQHLGERVYAFTYKNSLFVVLDNSKKILDESQLNFLEEQLKKGFEYTFVCLHVPPIDPEGTYCMLNPDEFIEIVLKYEVDYVLCSHIHAFYQENIGSTIIIISGGGGAPLTRGGFNHYVIIEVGDNITYTVVSV